jgi:hypothetical protein
VSLSIERKGQIAIIGFKHLMKEKPITFNNFKRDLANEVKKFNESYPGLNLTKEEFEEFFGLMIREIVEETLPQKK